MSIWINSQTASFIVKPEIIIKMLINLKVGQKVDVTNKVVNWHIDRYSLQESSTILQRKLTAKSWLILDLIRHLTIKIVTKIASTKIIFKEYLLFIIFEGYSKPMFIIILYNCGYSMGTNFYFYICWLK